MNIKKITTLFLFALPIFCATTFLGMEKKVEDYSCLCNVLLRKHERKDSAVLGYLKAQKEFEKTKAKNNTPLRTSHDRQQSVINKHEKLNQFLLENESVSANQSSPGLRRTGATSDKKEELRRRKKD